MIEARFAAACAVATLLAAAPAFAQSSPEPADPHATQSASDPAPVDPDAPASNSMDATGTFSVNPTLQSDPGMNDAAKVGPSRTDMNAESDSQ